MRKKYNCISAVNITKAITIALFVILPSLLTAQQSPSIQSGVTFQWSDSQSSLNDPATIESVTINGTMYNTFVVPSSYEMTRLGPDGHSPNRIKLNGNNNGGNSNSANWVTRATDAFQDKNLNHYFTSNPNGRNICQDFNAAATTDAQKQTIFYNPSIPSNEGGVLAVTERGGNNCFYIEIWGTPVGGGPEQKLGQTFVRNVGDYRGCNFAPPVNGSDYWRSGRCNENGQTIGIGLFYLSDIAPVGSKITKIEFCAATRDHGDGKFFLLQKYAIDQQETNCLNTPINGNIHVTNNLPNNSTYTLTSGPSPAGQSFTFNSDGTYTYMPSPGYVGDVTFNYEVCLPAPNTSVCDQATVTLTYVDLPPMPEIDVSCSSTNNFVISVTEPLGEEYEYSLNNGIFQSSPIFNNLTEGSYNLKVRNKYTTCEIEYPDNPFMLNNLELSGSVTDVVCNPDTTGAIDITVSGGAPPYSFSWSNGATTEDLTNVGAGTYTVTVNDSNNCPISQQFTISQPSSILSSTISKTDVSCKGESTGSIDLTINGGTAPYSFLWNTNSTNQDLSELAAGNYEVTITDASGCSVSQSVEIIEPSSSVIGSITDLENVDCFGNNNASVTVEANGGASPYIYSIDGGTNNQNSPIFQNLESGSYSILITDANECTSTVQFNIDEPNELTANIENVTNVLCANDSTGAIDIAVNGGTQPYTYAWSNNATTQDISNIISGVYSVTITDANGCTTSLNISVSEPANPLSINISKMDATTGQNCSNGSATASVTGGTAPYTYLWSASANNQNTATANNLTDGTHSVTVTDANNCTLTQSIVITCTNTCDAEVIIEETNNVSCFGESTGSGTVSASSNAYPDATFTFTWSTGQVDSGVTSSTINNVDAGVYDVSVTIDGTLCQEVEETIAITQPNTPLSIIAIATDLLGPLTNDGIIIATAVGGVPPYTYLWSPGGQNSNSISGLLIGTYSVTVTDANGCTAMARASVNPGSCNNLSISGSSTPVTCNGGSDGSVTATVSNGTGPFTYSWDNLPNTTASISNLPAGSYTVTVTDQTTKCTETTTITVSEPSALSSGVSATNVMCKTESTGSLDLTVNGGTTPYTFLWNNGATTEDLNNLEAGNYSVTITDANGCSTVQQATVSEPNEIVTASIVETKNIDCNSNSTGSITAEASGGIPPYLFSIDNGSNNQSSGLFENLAADNYTVLVTDANGCTVNINATLETIDNAVPEITVPSSLLLEGCSTDDINIASAIFPYSDIQSEDVQNIFESNPEYNGTDDSDIQSITYTDTVTSSDNCPIAVSRVFTITDNCNNTASATQTITIQDTTAPNLSIPNAITIECSEDESSANTGEATSSDNCSSVTISQSDVETPSCGNTKTITRTWTATDECGNTTSADQIITVEDTTPPDITIPEDITLECNEDTSSDNTGLAKAEDTCGGVTISESDTVTETCGNTKIIIRTWTATDNCNNSISGTQRITVVDTTAPTFSVPNDITIECDVDANDLSITGDVTDEADNCDTDLEATYSDSIANGSCANESTITRTWSLTDSCDNTTTLIQTINVVDTTAPTFSVPNGITIECDVDANDLSITGDVTDEADNCDTDLEATYSDSIANGSCANESTITRTWSLTDSCGNTTTLIQTINVVDTTAPTFSVPNGITIECDVDANDLSITGDVTDEADNCDTDLEATYSDSIANGSCANESTITRTWSLTDSCDNTTTLIQTLNVVDTTAPTFNESLPADIDIDCDVLPEAETLTAVDNCGEATVTLEETINPGSCDNTYTLIRTWTAEDSCGNQTNHTQTIKVKDSTAPNFNENLPADVNVECDAIPEVETLTAVDNCGEAIVTFEENTTAGSCDNNYSLTRIWTATDSCGNQTLHTQIINVVDTTAPIFNETVDPDIDAICDAVPEPAVLTATDNCGDATVTFEEVRTDGSCINQFTLDRTWTATDSCGNQTVITQIVKVKDSTAPVFTVPDDITIECDVNPNDLTITGDVTDEVDNCDTGLEATYTDSIQEGNCANESIITRTWTLTDACDATTTMVQTITVVDTTAPTFNETIETDIDVSCDAVPEPETLTASDNCGTANVTFEEVRTDGSCLNQYTLNRIWTATDSCGNQSVLTQLIKVKDSTAPLFTVPNDTTIECDVDPNDLTITGDVTDEIDNCDAGLEATYSDSVTAGNCANESVISRTWSLTDACNNTTTLVQTIHVVDTTAPTFTVPNDITIECDADATDLTITGDVTDEADNCDTDLEASFSDSQVVGTCANESTITRTWSLIDSCNNTTTFVQTINIVDTVAPIIDNQPNDIIIECDGNGNNSEIQDWLDINGGATASDSCGNVVWTNNYNGAVSDCSNPIEVIFTATDECGNTATTSATYSVQDTNAPNITTQALNLTVECDGSGNTTELNTWLSNNGGAIANDDCSELTWTNDFTILSDECGSSGSATVIFTVTDACGNSETTTGVFTIEDTISPTFNENLPADADVECDAIPIAETLTANESCGEATVNFVETTTDGTCDNTYTLTRTWTATDACNNEVVHTQTINVTDNIAPVFNETLPIDIDVECDAVPLAETLTANDSCGEATVDFVETTTEGICDNTYTLTRTWTATDACDNEVVHVQTINVTDNTAPVFNESLPTDIDVECDAVPEAEILTATDSCGSASVTFVEEIINGACVGDYIITRTWTANDVCNNITEHTQIITVEDTTAPTIVVPDDEDVAYDENITVACNEIPEVPELVFEDACSNDISVSFNEESTQTNDFDDYQIIRTWSVLDDCDNEALFTQTINVEISNVMNAFDASRCVLDSEFDLFDLLSGDFSMDGTWSVISGEATLNGSLFDPSSVEVGMYTFIYSITEGACPREIEVNITVDDDCVVLACGKDDVIISKTVTANGDTFNDFFTVSGIDECGFVIELQIFNRWGAKIYESKNYQNDWNGDAHGSSVGNSGKVPTGTYYYVINLRNSGLEPFAGPIYVATK